MSFKKLKTAYGAPSGRQISRFSAAKPSNAAPEAGPRPLPHFFRKRAGQPGKTGRSASHPSARDGRFPLLKHTPEQPAFAHPPAPIENRPERAACPKAQPPPTRASPETRPSASIRFTLSQNQAAPPRAAVPSPDLKSSVPVSRFRETLPSILYHESAPVSTPFSLSPSAVFQKLCFLRKAAFQRSCTPIQ